MQHTITQIHQNIRRLKNEIYHIPKKVIAFKPNPNKWSRKEILGHLIDSARFNLMRFNALVTFEEKVYHVIPYPQDDLVKLNDYQETDLVELVMLWQTLNRQICRAITSISSETLTKKIQIGEKLATFQWLIEDYPVHMEYHVNQILASYPKSETAIPYHITPKEALIALEKVPTEFVKLLEHGELEVEYYKPEKIDKQHPHDRDEVYVITSGHSHFILENDQYQVKTNNVLFVKAGEEHRFVDFSNDFATWVFFYGQRIG